MPTLDMQRRNRTQLSQNSLYPRILLILNQYYPWLIVVAIAYLFFLQSSLLFANPSEPQTMVRTIVQERKISYTKYPKILFFIGDKSNRGKGQLIAVNTKEASIDGAFKALSGVGGKENQPMRGPIPSTVNLEKISYWVQTSPLTLSNPGIAGKFFKINPHLVKVQGVTRGDFGIHADRNVPGTAGCIGIESEKDWEDFKLLIADYNRAGLKEIPLIVSYK
ncbi:MAG: hypothetical protein QNJ64_08460 [Crocosphaera sp.]|nr:hypothetical protein [Crocosphaera sp.]